jgi:hypothetical protein
MKYAAKIGESKKIGGQSPHVAFSQCVSYIRSVRREANQLHNYRIKGGRSAHTTFDDTEKSGNDVIWETGRRHDESFIIGLNDALCARLADFTDYSREIEETHVVTIRQMIHLECFQALLPCYNWLSDTKSGDAPAMCLSSVPGPQYHHVCSPRT